MKPCNHLQQVMKPPLSKYNANFYRDVWICGIKKLFSSGIESCKEFLEIQLRPILQLRRFQVYCVGTAKSGTHSIAGLFCPHYRVSHEPQSRKLIHKILDKANGQITKENFVDYIRKRDKLLWLEIDSSNLNYYLIDTLVQEFPESKFILTIRDCYSWLDSFINHLLSRPGVPGPVWKELLDFQFKKYDFKFEKQERALATNGKLYPLGSCLSYWAEHNKKVIGTVPKDRLLIIRTHEIEQKIKEIAYFLKIPPETLNHANAHSYKAKEKFRLLSKIDNDFLKGRIEMHCRSLMNEFFPDFKEMRDL